jgi:hypothetical protein
MAGYYGEDNTALYGIPPVSGNTGGAGLDPELANLLTLISSVIEKPPLMPPPTPPMPQGTLRTVAGNLGDAIAAMAAVRAGGQAPQVGGFQASQMMRQQDYKKQQEDYLNRTAALESEGRTTRNAAKIGAISESQRQKSAEKVAGMRAQATSKYRYIPSTVEKDGKPMRAVDVFDPETNEWLGQRILGPAAYAPAILPGMEITKEGFPIAGFYRTSRTGGGPTTRVEGPGGSRLEPQPAPGMAQEAGGKIGVLKGIPGLQDAYEKADMELRGSGKMDQIVNWAYSRTANTPLATIVQPPEMQSYYANMRAILAPYVRSVSGLVFPEEELVRYENRMPIPGVTPPEVVDQQWEALIGEMVRDIKAKYGASGRTPPAIPDVSKKPAEATGTVQETPEQRRKRLLEEYDAAHPR